MAPTVVVGTRATQGESPSTTTVSASIIAGAGAATNSNNTNSSTKAVVCRELTGYVYGRYFLEDPLVVDKDPCRCERIEPAASSNSAATTTTTTVAATAENTKYKVTCPLDYCERCATVNGTTICGVRVTWYRFEASLLNLTTVVTTNPRNPNSNTTTTVLADPGTALDLLGEGVKYTNNLTGEIMVEQDPVLDDCRLSYSTSTPEGAGKPTTDYCTCASNENDKQDDCDSEHVFDCSQYDDGFVMGSCSSPNSGGLVNTDPPKWDSRWMALREDNGFDFDSQCYSTKEQIGCHKVMDYVYKTYYPGDEILMSHSRNDPPCTCRLDNGDATNPDRELQVTCMMDYCEQCNEDAGVCAMERDYYTFRADPLLDGSTTTTVEDALKFTDQGIQYTRGNLAGKVSIENYYTTTDSSDVPQQQCKLALAKEATATTKASTTRCLCDYQDCNGDGKIDVDNYKLNCSSLPAQDNDRFVLNSCNASQNTPEPALTSDWMALRRDAFDFSSCHGKLQIDVNRTAREMCDLAELLVYNLLQADANTTLVEDHASCHGNCVPDYDRGLLRIGCDLDYCEECDVVARACGRRQYHFEFDLDPFRYQDFPEQRAFRSVTQCVNFTAGGEVDDDAHRFICQETMVQKGSCSWMVGNQTCLSCGQMICADGETYGVEGDCTNLEDGRGTVFSDCPESDDPIPFDSPLFVLRSDSSMQFETCFDPDFVGTLSLTGEQGTSSSTSSNVVTKSNNSHGGGGRRGRERKLRTRFF